LTGQIFDSLLEGLEYTGSGGSGITNSNGSFSYTAGKTVKFHVGDIVLGSLTPGAVVSPIDLIAGADVPTDDDEIINIARFLQTIDSDADADNGIEITAAVRTAAIGQTINFDQDTSAWESDPAVLATVSALTSNALVSADDATDHFEAWLTVTRAGEYGGTFTDPSNVLNGKWKMSVSTIGEIIFIVSVPGIGDTGTAAPEIAPNGDFSASWDSADFQGSVTGSSVSGTWMGKGLFAGYSGSFSGSLQTKAMTFLDADLIDNFKGLDYQVIFGDILDDGVNHTAIFNMFLYHRGSGLYAVRMDMLFDDGSIEEASFYATSMTADTIKFRGLCTSGEGFVGTLEADGDVSGTYYNLDPSDPGGTFSGSL
jgi:hypothetical protein